MALPRGFFQQSNDAPGFLKDVPAEAFKNMNIGELDASIEVYKQQLEVFQTSLLKINEALDAEPRKTLIKFTKDAIEQYKHLNNLSEQLEPNCKIIDENPPIIADYNKEVKLRDTLINSIKIAETMIAKLEELKAEKQHSIKPR